MKGYTNADRQRIIYGAIRSYGNKKLLRGISKTELIKTLNEMENVYVMCVPWGVRGICELKKTIDEIRKEVAI